MEENFKIAQVYLDENKLNVMRGVALKNDCKLSKQKLNDMAWEIATAVISNLETSDLEQVTNLKFK